MREWTAGFYLIMSPASGRRGKYLNFRMTERSPALKANEISLYVQLSVPSAMFTKPSLRATIKVPVEGVTPPTIDAEVASNIAEVVRERTGLNVTITVEPGAS